MNLDNLNNLIELFANQANRQNKKDIFLEWLNPSNKKTYTWEQTEKYILKLSKVIKQKLIQLFGDEAYVDGKLNRPFLAKMIFKDKSLLNQMKLWKKN